METNTKESKNTYQPKNGDFVKLISGYDAYEIIFRCIANDEICNYAILDLRHSGSVSYTNNWLPNKFDIFPSDGSSIINALRNEGKTWNANLKRFEDYNIPRIGDKCIFWNDYSSVIVVDTFTKDSYYNNPYSIRENKYLWEAAGLCFENCVKYSNKKLIEIANRNYNKNKKYEYGNK